MRWEINLNAIWGSFLVIRNEWVDEWMAWLCVGDVVFCFCSCTDRCGSGGVLFRQFRYLGTFDFWRFKVRHDIREKRLVTPDCLRWKCGMPVNAVSDAMLPYYVLANPHSSHNTYKRYVIRSIRVLQDNQPVSLIDLLPYPSQSLSETSFL